MNIYAYTAYKNPHEAAKIVQSYGGRPAPDKFALAKQLAHAVNVYGQDALDKILRAHPDFDQITSMAEPEVISKDFSNACGCSGYHHMDGRSNARGEKETSKTEILLIGGVILIGLAMVLKHTK